MKKFILLSILSVFLYSAPGYTMLGEEEEAPAARKQNVEFQRIVAQCGEAENQFAQATVQYLRAESERSRFELILGKAIARIHADQEKDEQAQATEQSLREKSESSRFELILRKEIARIHADQEKDEQANYAQAQKNYEQATKQLQEAHKKLPKDG